MEYSPFIQIVSDIITLVITAGFQHAVRHFVFTDIERQKALSPVIVKNGSLFKFILDQNRATSSARA